MGIKIYTYSNPYEIDKESFWNEINNCPQFCVSQTMVNGLKEIYPDFKNKPMITTMRILLNSLYHDWEEKNTKMRQMMEVDNCIEQMSINLPDASNIKRSLEFNTSSLVDCIRLFYELSINPEDINTENLNINQQLLVDIFKHIFSRKNTSFEFKHANSFESIDNGIKNALKSKYKNISIDGLNFNTIVIHGIHQFSAAMLCAIEDISKYKNIILLFNYQKQYKAIYQTWLNVYSLFQSKININSDNEFIPIPLYTYSYSSNVLADCLGKLANGKFDVSNSILNNISVIEFENVTEFAGYVAKKFEKAKNIQKKTNKNIPVLTFMEDQLYSASGKVNDILRAYFPEQFGERHFLDYPIGHFFVSLTNMWDPENEEAVINNLSDIKECLSSGIIFEKQHGKLLDTLNRIEPYIEKVKTLDELIKEVHELKKYVSPSSLIQQRLGYLEVSKQDVIDLKNALKELSQIIKTFFSDFNKGGDNFQRFYNEIRKFIIGKVENIDSLDEEMRELLQRLLERMENIDLPETGTFNCLKQTMAYYLSQDESLAKGANWIVRDFEQIDGDILRSARQAKQNPENMCYHFCCLSDKDICSSKDEKLPWPLDISFFEYAVPPDEWKYQIFMKSKMEYKNFKRYALVYGLEFNRLKCKLSYIKTENQKDNDLFYMLSLLGIKIEKYHSGNNSNYVPKLKYDTETKINKFDCTPLDSIRYNMCPYRFALETVVQEHTLFRDRFLIHHYIRIILENETKRKLSGRKYDDKLLKQTIDNTYQEISLKFKICTELEKTQIIARVYKSIKENALKKDLFSKISNEYINNMKIQEELLYDHKKISSDVDIKKLTDILNDYKRYPLKFGDYCMYCGSKDICLHSTKD